MDIRIASLPDAPLPLDPDSYYEVLVPDGSSATGYTSCKIKPSIFDGVKRIKSLLSQSGTTPPTEINLLNNTGSSITFGYTSVGVYTMDLGSLFVANKTFVMIQQTANELGGTNAALVTLQYDGGTGYIIRTFDDSLSPANKGLNKTALIIEVYQ